MSGLGIMHAMSPKSSAQDLLTILETCPSDYVFVVDATMLPIDSFDSTLCTRALQQTKAQVFCCDRGVMTADGCVQKFVQVHSVQVHDDVYGWQFARGEYSWHKPFGASAHIYAKKTLNNALSRYKKQAKGRAIFDELNDLMIDKDAVGLCCKKQLFKERV